MEVEVAILVEEAVAHHRSDHKHTSCGAYRSHHTGHVHDHMEKVAADDRSGSLGTDSSSTDRTADSCLAVC